jgi:hypothetical protein
VRLRAGRHDGRPQLFVGSGFVAVEYTSSCSKTGTVADGSFLVKCYTESREDLLNKCFRDGYCSLRKDTTRCAQGGSHVPPNSAFGPAPNPPGTINTSTSFGGASKVCVGTIACDTIDLRCEGSPSTGPVETGTSSGPMMLSFMSCEFGCIMG